MGFGLAHSLHDRYNLDVRVRLPRLRPRPSRLHSTPVSNEPLGTNLVRSCVRHCPLRLTVVAASVFSGSAAWRFANWIDHKEDRKDCQTEGDKRQAVKLAQHLIRWLADTTDRRMRRDGNNVVASSPEQSHLRRALRREDLFHVSVNLTDGQRNVTRLCVDTLLCFVGLAKDLSALSTWRICADRNGIPVDPTTTAAGRPSIYAIGDIADDPGKLNLILTGFSEAATTAHHARTHLKPGEYFPFTRSTMRGQPDLVLQDVGS